LFGRAIVGFDRMLPRNKSARPGADRRSGISARQLEQRTGVCPGCESARRRAQLRSAVYALIIRIATSARSRAVSRRRILSRGRLVSPRSLRVKILGREFAVTACADPMSRQFRADSPASKRLFRMSTVRCPGGLVWGQLNGPPLRSPLSS